MFFFRKKKAKLKEEENLLNDKDLGTFDEIEEENYDYSKIKKNETKDLGKIYEKYQKEKKKHKTGLVLSLITVTLLIAPVGYVAYISSFNPDIITKRISLSINDFSDGNYINGLYDLFSENTAYLNIRKEQIRTGNDNGNIDITITDKTINNTLSLARVPVKNEVKKIKHNNNKKEQQNSSLTEMKIYDKIKKTKTEISEKEIKPLKNIIIAHQLFENKKTSNKEIEQIKKEISLLEKEIKSIKQNQKQNIQNKDNFEEKLMNKINSQNAEIAKIKEEILILTENENNNTKNIKKEMQDLAVLQKETALLNGNMKNMKTNFQHFKNVLKGIDNTTIAQLKELVKSVEEKTEKLQKLNSRVQKIKKVFQNEIELSIKLASEVKGLEKKYDILQSKIRRIAGIRAIAHKNAQNGNLAGTETVSKRDYINAFGFYYAGYSENDSGAIGYIAGPRGKIYEVRKGDVINGKYQVIKINPLYLKLKNLNTGRVYTISYKE